MELKSALEWLRRPENHTYVTTGCAALAVVITAIYTLFAVLQWFAMQGQLGEMKKTNEMTRQQLIGLQAAVISLTGQPTWRQPEQTVTIHLVNSGAITGMLNNFSATLQRKHLPGESPIGEPFIIELHSHEMPKSQGYELTRQLPWQLPRLTDQSQWPGDEIVSMTGHYTYTDGFGDSFDHDFCFVWFPPWDLHVPIPNGAGWSGGQWRGDGTATCPTVQGEVNEFNGYKRHVEEVSPKR